MMHGDVIQLTQQALWYVLLLSAPPIIVAAVVGFLIAFIQAATQIQEQTLQYAAKFFAIAVTIFITASMLGGGLYQYGDRVFSGLTSGLNTNAQKGANDANDPPDPGSADTIDALIDRLFGDPNGIFTTAAITLGGIEDFFVLGVSGDAPFDAGHGKLLRSLT